MLPDPAGTLESVQDPVDEAGVIDAIREARARGEPLAIEGRGTKRGMLRPVQAARTLTTRRLSGITLHAPTELIVSARAGTTLEELNQVLATGNQALVAEPPDLSALLGSGGPQTVGGLVATNLSGPRRVTSGAMRDHVMGVRAVNGTAELIRAGGRVLKNVTGLDVCKLLSGSHGTLAVLTEITLKVLPVAELTGSLVLRGLAPEAGVAALSAALGSPYGVTGAAYIPAGHVLPGVGTGPLAIVRIEEFAPSVAYRLGRLTELLPGADTLDDATSRAAWCAIRDAVPLAPEPEHALWRISVRPSRGPGVLAAVLDVGGRGFLDWGGGLVWAAAPPDAHAAVTGAVVAAGGVWTLMRAPDALRTSVDVVPVEGEALRRIARRVKGAMDPGGVLNPGRIWAGL